MNIREKILVIEDEKSIARFISTILTANGYEAMRAASGAEAMSMISSHCPDLVILDLGLPDMDGLDILRQLRSWSTLPVVVVSARSHEQDKVSALDLGADDYLTKPFGVGELMARVRVALRRSQAHAARNGAEPVPFRFGQVEVDLVQRRVLRQGLPVHLTPIEYRLLTHLIANAGKVLTHYQLLKAVWGPSHIEDNHYLRVYMGNLRQKLEELPAQPRHLLTETAVGYRLMP